jgi:LmbE family N-acetylglucosaminyl deacetylase
MSALRRLMAVLAHPDDESLGFGGTLAKYAADGVEVSLVTATRGETGRFNGHPPGDPNHPGPSALGTMREVEVRRAAAELGIRHVEVLDYPDRHLDAVDPASAIGRIAAHVRRFRPDVVVTFGPDGAYGHPDHIAISQLTAGAVISAAAQDSALDDAAPPHVVSKLYYLAWPASTWAIYQAAVRMLSATVDGVVRQATPWPDWALTTTIDATGVWEKVWRAVSCHASQLASYDGLPDLSPERHRALWGTQSFYRVFSRVNGGRTRETDLFAGVAR